MSCGETFASNMLNMCVLSHGVLDGYFLLIVRSGRVFRPTNGGQIVWCCDGCVCGERTFLVHAVSCAARGVRALGAGERFAPATPRRRAVRAGSGAGARGASGPCFQRFFSKDMYTTYLRSARIS